jgi:hypothetical protein
MNHDLRKILRATVEFIVFLGVFVSLYMLIWRLYDPVVLWTANTITGVLSPATRMDTGRLDNWRCFIETPGGGEWMFRWWTPIQRHLIYLNQPLVLALLLATPTTWGNRLRLAGLGALVAFVGHVLVAVTMMRAMVCLNTNPTSFLCIWALKVCYVSGQLLGAAIWGVFAWRYWFPSKQALRSSG